MNSIPIALLQGIISGKAVLFTGAGFSRECENISSSAIIAAEDLSEEICSLGGFTKSKNLKYSADRYILAKPENALKLVDFLKKNYTTKSVKHYIDKIINFKWKYIYTTNYDDVIEISSKCNGIEIVPVDMDQNIDDIDKSKLNCIHINGFIKTLTSENLNKTFKLSDSSYCNPDGFLNSPWYTIFKRTIERCSALVFVGYSLYDIDVKRLLASIDGLKERTFFITSPTSSEEDMFTLEQFGHVYNCGVEIFSDLLPDPSTIVYSVPALNCLAQYVQNDSEVDINDSDIDSLLLYGEYNKIIIDNMIFSNRDSEYVVIRDALLRIEKLIADSNIVITSELGNGKTILLQQIMPYLSKKYHIYNIDDYFGDVISDLELLSSETDMSIVVIDNYNTLIDLFDSYRLYSKEKLRFILSARSSVHENKRETLKNSGFEFKEISIDLFSSKEITSLTNLVDSVGLWGVLNSKQHEKRTYFIEDCNSQINAVRLRVNKKVDKVVKVSHIPR